jgi:hypothetical protein
MQLQMPSPALSRLLSWWFVDALSEIAFFAASSSVRRKSCPFGAEHGSHTTYK